MKVERISSEVISCYMERMSTIHSELQLSSSTKFNSTKSRSFKRQQLLKKFITVPSRILDQTLALQISIGLLVVDVAFLIFVLFLQFWPPLDYPLPCLYFLPEIFRLLTTEIRYVIAVHDKANA
uniref:Uncharacterized protein n=1 Tax=Arundo donax TaxID=35708 RepID=A0A0A9D9N6_ARUDO